MSPQKNSYANFGCYNLAIDKHPTVNFLTKNQKYSEVQDLTVESLKKRKKSDTHHREYIKAENRSFEVSRSKKTKGSVGVNVIE